MSQITIQRATELAQNALFRVQGVAQVAAATSRKYAFYVTIVTVVATVVKLLLATNIGASPLFSDDYDYINKSVYYVHGDFRAADYPFSNVAAGIVYPLVISAWMLFHTPALKILAVFASNAALGGVTIFFGSQAVAHLAGRRSLVAPLIIATMPAAFLFTFTAMTENALFAFLALSVWLILKADTCIKRPWWIVTTIVVIVVAPLVRPPGMAIAAAVAAAALVRWKDLGWRRAFPLAAGTLALGVASYLLVYKGLLPARWHGIARETRYVSAAGNSLSSPYNLLVGLRLLLNQGWYLLVSLGLWPFVCFLAGGISLVMRMRTRSFDRQFMQWTFGLTLSGALLAFALLHLVMKVQFELDRADYILGRYVDPAALVILLFGLGALLGRPTWSWLLRVVAPLLLACALSRIVGHQWSSVSQAGLALFFAKGLNFTYVLSGAVVVTLLCQLPQKRLVPWAMVVMLVFNVLSIRVGFDYFDRRARGVEYATEAATWISANLPATACIAYDERVAYEGAPRALKQVANVYRAMKPMTHPRDYRRYKPGMKSTGCRYVYTTKSAIPYVQWKPLWQNEYYILYETDPAAPLDLELPDGVFSYKIEPRALRTSDRRMLQDNRLVMAWHTCAAATRILWIPPGDYELLIRAKATGCSSPPPRVMVHFAGYDHELLLTPGPPQDYVVPFTADVEQLEQVELTFFEEPYCEDGSDKNVFVDFLQLTRVADPSQ